MEVSRSRGRDRLLAFGISGAIWSFGILMSSGAGAEFEVFTSPMALLVAGPALLATIAVTFAGRYLWQVLGATWAVGVLPVFWLLMQIGPPAPGETVWPIALAASLVIASLIFVAWAATASAILAFMRSGRTTSAA